MTDNTDFYSEGGDHRLAFSVVMYITCISSSLISIAMISLMCQMGINTNGHSLLIFLMTCSQFIYDISFYPGVITISSVGFTVFANVLQLIGGIGVSIISNIVTMIVLYIILYRKSVDIYKNLKWFTLVTFTIIFSEVFLYLLGVVDSSYEYLSNIALLDIYYYSRLVSILFNFIFCGLAYLYVRRMKSDNMASHSPALQAICVLSERMQYYPIVQAISRSGCAWYEFVYQWNFDPLEVTKVQFAAQIYVAIITPMASVGYLMVSFHMLLSIEQ